MSTEKIASFVANINYDRIPQQVIAVAEGCILDGLGIMLAGSVEHAGSIITSHVKEIGGQPEAGVIGGKFRTSAPQAALANGVMAHALDYDDAIEGWGGHLTAVILPTVLALGEREKRSGKEILEAFITGWEVGAKIGAEIGLTLQEQGLHAHAVVGPLAASAAACKVMKLNEKEIRVAFGIASAEAFGLRLNNGTDTKPFHAGKGAQSGVVAALLARKGFTANESILEGNLGLPKVLTQKDWDPARLSAGLGAPFSLISPGVSTKFYPSCGLTQRSIDAMLHLIKENYFVAEDVEEVECKTPLRVSQLLRFSRPQTGQEGKFSMQYCMAAALLDGEVTLRQFTDEKVTTAKAQELMHRVVFTHPEGAVKVEGGRGEQMVTVKLRNGKRYSHEVIYAKGEPQNPMSWEEIAFKFRHCAQLVLMPSSVERAVELVSNLDSLQDITELMNIVTGERK